MCVEDALLALKYGADAIWVSAHGARYFIEWTPPQNDNL